MYEQDEKFWVVKNPTIARSGGVATDGAMFETSSEGYIDFIRVCTPEQLHDERPCVYQTKLAAIEALTYRLQSIVDDTKVAIMGLDGMAEKIRKSA